MDRYAVIDFETTGLRAGIDRSIEVGAVLVQNGRIVQSFCQLMNPGIRLPYFITQLTGISDAMVANQPRPEEVMPRLRRFLDHHVCIAHNAAFDQRFFVAEMDLAGEAHERTFLCSMLLARRMVQNAPSHKLGELARHLRLPRPAQMKAHRALSDVHLTCALWRRLTDLVRARLAGRTPDLTIVRTLMKTPKHAVEPYLTALAHGGVLPARATRRRPAT